MFRRFLLIFLILTLMGLTAFAAGKDEAVNLPVPEGYNAVTVDGITLQWKVEDQNLRVQVAAATTGWISVGFDPTSRMKDANIIIGYVESGQVFLRDDFGVSGSAHKADESLGGTSDISDAQGNEKDGQTILSFVIALDSEDPYDRALEAGKSYKIILAVGTKDDFGSYHGTKRTSVTVEL
jgi:hypothetical protein